MDGVVQDSSELAMELLQSCAKPFTQKFGLIIDGFMI